MYMSITRGVVYMYMSITRGVRSEAQILSHSVPIARLFAPQSAVRCSLAI